MSQRARGIQSIEVSGRILRALVDAHAPMMLKELAQAADLAPAQCHAYLTSLRHVGLVHQDPISGLYRSGSFALRLGIAWMKCDLLASAAIGELKALTDELGVMSLLAVWGVSGPTIIHMNAGITQTALNIRQGTVFSVTGTATGRVFAAFGAPPDLEQHIAVALDESRRSDRIGSVLTREDFEHKLQATRNSGYASADGTPIPGINAVAAPIFDRRGKMKFVATLLGPAAELSTARDSAAVHSLLAATGRLSGAEGAGRSATAGSRSRRTAGLKV